MTDTILPKDIEYPKGGEVYEAIEDVELNYIIHHFAPYTHGEKCVFPKQQRLIVHPPVQEKPKGVYGIPVEYDKMEEKLIPEAEKSTPDYSNYSLFVDTEILNTKFKKIEKT